MKNIYLLVVNHYTDFNGEIWCLSVSGDENEIVKYKNSEESKKKVNQGPYAKKGIYLVIHKDVIKLLEDYLKQLMMKKKLFGFFRN